MNDKRTLSNAALPTRGRSKHGARGRTPNWRRGNGKLAEDVAHAIESEIMTLGWPVGRSLGSEPDLIERFGVSRAVFREAVRIVEHHGAARMRRGPGGGLIVTVPEPESAVQPVTLFLDHADVTAQDLFDARSSLEVTCARLAAERIDERGVERLREVLAAEADLGPNDVADGHPHEIHVAIAEVTGNAALKLLVEIFTRLMFERTAHMSFTPSELKDVHRAHVAIVDAIVSRDAAQAEHRLKRHLAASTKYYHPRGGDEG